MAVFTCSTGLSGEAAGMFIRTSKPTAIPGNEDRHRRCRCSPTSIAHASEINSVPGNEARRWRCLPTSVSRASGHSTAPRDKAGTRHPLNAILQRNRTSLVCLIHTKHIRTSRGGFTLVIHVPDRLPVFSNLQCVLRILRLSWSIMPHASSCHGRLCIQTLQWRWWSQLLPDVSQSLQLQTTQPPAH